MALEELGIDEKVCHCHVIPVIITGSGYVILQLWSITHDNVLNVNFSNATALFIYLVPEGIKAIRESLVAVSLRKWGHGVLHVVF
jgi:hypothetical protein